MINQKPPNSSTTLQALLGIYRTLRTFVKLQEPHTHTHKPPLARSTYNNNTSSKNNNNNTNSNNNNNKNNNTNSNNNDNTDNNTSN